MPSINLLAISNPSDYWRSGSLAVPWQPIYQKFQIPPEELVLRDLRDRFGNPLLAQVDRIEPEEPSRDTLVFSLNEAIPPGAKADLFTSAFIRVERGKPVPTEIGEPELEVVWVAPRQERGVRLTNNRLIAWFNLVAAPENDGHNWYSGSATSVQLDRQEFLDPFLAVKGEWLGQNPEKRCMQIDCLQLPGTPHPKSPYYQVYLFNHSYRLVSQSRGPVRASITIASEPFEYIGSDPDTGENRHLSCQLYRVISLYAGAPYLIEELFVKGKSSGEEGEHLVGKEIVNLSFSPHYFAHMDMGHPAKIYQPSHLSNWFASGSTSAPYPGYGFATDLQIDSVTYPHEGNENCFSWRLLPSRSTKCLHLFMRCPQQDFDSRTGHHWYELLYQPLKAEIYQDTQVIPDRHGNFITT